MKYRDDEDKDEQETFVLRRILLLLWKNLLFRRRHWLVTAFEIILPTLAAFTIAFMKTLMTESGATVEKNNTIYSPTYPHEYYGFTSIELLCPGCILGFTPNTTATIEIMRHFKMRFNDSYSVDEEYDFELRGFNSEADMSTYLSKSDFLDNVDPPLKAGIVFNEISPKKITYTLRPASYTIHTNTIFSWLQLPGPELENSASYLNGGVAGLQIALDKILVQVLTDEELGDDLMLRAFPYPPYFKAESFSHFYFIVLPQLFIIGFIFIVPSIIRNTVSERESGIKELMKLMGLPNWMHWLGWMLNSMLILSFSVTIVMFLLFYTFNPESGPVITYGDVSLWWVVFFLYTMAATAFCFFVSVFSSKPALATTIGIVCWIVSYYALFVPMEASYRNLSTTSKLLAALSPNMGLHWAIKIMCSFEGKGTGSHWSNIYSPISLFDSMSLLYICIMFVVDIFLYVALTLYLENILPSRFGIRKPWYYIFQWKTWNPKAPSKRRQSIANSLNLQKGFEAEPEDLTATIRIYNLTKKFGKKTAVDGISLRMYEGQITALLGHNGAGKTTTISILTGLFKSTSGTAVLNGYDINKDLDKVRSSLGLCPQHNMLFDKLTVEEHLIFFARIKGKSAEQAVSEMRVLVQKLQLKEKIHTMSMDLSGGQKRKLCLGMALIGGTKIVILDEPTSGMDPEARRVIWDLLLELRQNRTILLTTHFMEEADILGDRVAVMADGKVQCVGTPLFLKKSFGTGYTLKMTTTLEAKAENILHLVQKHIPQAYIKRDAPPSIDISLSSENTSTGKFSPMFTDLSLYEKDFGIIAKGLTPTTMDEVFLHIGDMNHKKEKNGTNGHAEYVLDTPVHEKEADKQLITGFQLTVMRFFALIWKKIHYSRRQKRLLILQFVIPPILLIWAILLSSQTFTPAISSPPLEMNFKPYQDPHVLYSVNNSTFGDSYQSILGSVAQKVDDMIDGLLQVGLRDLGSYREQYIMGAVFESNETTAMYSTSPHHAVPLSINTITNAILQTYDPEASIKAIIHPLENELSSILEAAQPNPAYTVLVPIIYGAFVPIALALFGSTFMIFPTEERLSKAKQLQLMTGVSPLTFWSTSFLWDMLVTIVAILVMLACFPLCQKYGSYTSYGAIGVMMVILLVWGFSAIMFSYVFSLFVPSPHGGYAAQTIVHLLTGLVLPIAVFSLGTSSPGATAGIRAFGSVFPTFGASMSIMRYASIATANGRCNIIPHEDKALFCRAGIEVDPLLLQCCDNCMDINNNEFTGVPACFEPAPFLTWSHYLENNVEAWGIGREILGMCCCGIFYFVVLVLIESGLLKWFLSLPRKLLSGFPRFQYKFREQPDDDNVVAESDRVKEMINAKNYQDALIVNDLCKNFGNFAAVSNINFAVRHGECFGLLGVNGAGKTTTFRMLTGDEEFSQGNVYNDENSLGKDRVKFLARIGYCPQFDAIINVLSGREMLQLFARLRGIPADQQKYQVDKWLDKLGLLKSGNIECGNYSGGMKRRLSVAMAMIADPEIIFLDEPTSGVDPVARRQFWDVIASLRGTSQCVVLTSHSMEECESLCSRLGIMVNGQLQCLGGVQHLKKKFATGYSLVIQLNADIDPSKVNELKNDIITTFSPCRLQDQHQNVLQFQVLSTNFTWETMFESIEQLKVQYKEEMEDYLLSETTLEQVFLNFARQQYPTREGERFDMFQKLCRLCGNVSRVKSSNYTVRQIDPAQQRAAAGVIQTVEALP